MSDEKLPDNYRLVKDKVLEQWWIMCDDFILIPYAINSKDEAYAMALSLSREASE